MANRALRRERGVELPRRGLREFGTWAPVSDGKSSSLVNSSNDFRQRIADGTPRAVQPFLTWLTAKPADGEALPVHDPLYHLATALLSLLVGVAVSLFELSEGGWLLLLLPVGWILTTSGMGKLQAVIYHHCSHRTVLSRPVWNEWLGEAISIVLLIKRFDTYRREHLQHHRASVQLTDDDEFLQFLQDRLDMRIGEPETILRRKILRGMISPLFHVRCLVGRIRACFGSGRRGWDATSALAWAGLFSLVTYYEAWPEFTMVWLFPLVILFQIATSLRILCEHRFPQGLGNGRGAGFICEVTAGVVPAEPPPESPNAYAWCFWWAKMLTLHLFCRVFVLVGDAPAHDYHHRHPQTGDWPNHIQARQNDVDLPNGAFPTGYVEYWGLFAAIDNIVHTMSQYRRSS